MEAYKEFYCKFPVVLRDKLKNKEIEFPKSTKFKYEKFIAYRAVERKKDEFNKVTLDDFKSYYELKKYPKKARGNKKDTEKDPHYYGVSLNLDKRIIEQKMKFPNPNKKMAFGYICEEYGPQSINDNHVCWWLYETADVSNFKLMEVCNNE